MPVIEMNEKVRREWIEALRSGEYSQTALSLKNEVGYCCLGVLCEIAAKHGVIEPPIKIDGHYSYEGFYTYLPPAVQDWAELPDKAGASGAFEAGNVARDNLSALNDSGASFEDIAELLER